LRKATKICEKKKKTMVYIMLFFAIAVCISPYGVCATGNYNNSHLVIMLDPGHGGEEDGANYYGLQEKNLNLKLAKLVQQELQEYQGADVMLTRDSDEEVSLWERANRASVAGADILLSIHFNASSSHKSNGSSIYISTGEYNKERLMKLGDYLLGEFEYIGLNNAGMFARVTQMNGRRADGSFDDYYGVLRHSYNHGIPSMIIEHCYMDSEVDKEYFNTEEGLRSLAQADANAIAAYYGLCKPDEEAPKPKNATKFGVTTKAVEQEYFDAPLIKSVLLKEYDGKTPGKAIYEVEVEDGVGLTTLYLVYKNVEDGSSFTLYLNLETSLQSGTHMATAYFPSKLPLGQYQLSYIGAYNEVGLDAGYNYYNGSMVGYGKCDWLNTFAYYGEADLKIVEETHISPIKTEHIVKNVLRNLRYKKELFLQPIK